MGAVERFTHLNDDELLSRTQKVVAVEQCVTAHLIALLAEVDYRRLYLAQGFSSMFAYCTEALKLTEHAAYFRIEAARVARRLPVVLERLAVGELSLTAVCLLSGHLTRENAAGLLNEARHKSKREVELIVARLNPVAATLPSLRKVATVKPVMVLEGDTAPLMPAPAHPEGSGPPAEAAPAPVESYRLQVTLSRTAHDKLRCAQNLLRHAVPSGDLGTVLERAIDALLDEIEKKKLAFVARPARSARAADADYSAGPHESTPRPASRHIPAAVRRAVWSRDGGRCAFVGAAGRCGSRAFIEIHHVRPFAAGGEATVENIELRCRAHNAYEAEIFFSPKT